MLERSVRPELGGRGAGQGRREGASGSAGAGVVVGCLRKHVLGQVAAQEEAAATGGPGERQDWVRRPQKGRRGARLPLQGGREDGRSGGSRPRPAPCPSPPGAGGGGGRGRGWPGLAGPPGGAADPALGRALLAAAGVGPGGGGGK